MLIRLESVQESPFRWEETVTVDAAEVDLPELNRLGPVSWQGEVSYADPDYFLTARYEYEQMLACGRCLKEVPSRVRGEIQLLLTLEAPNQSGEVALKEEELGCVQVDEEVEINQFLLEQLALNVPMTPRCGDDCQGLCSECGADLNEGPCGCDRTTVDPRWEALAGLKARLSRD